MSATKPRGAPAARSTLRANGAKIATDSSDNCRAGVKRVEEWIGEGQTSLREYKKEIEMLRQEIGLMENHLSTQNDENVKVINPHVMQNFEDL